MNDIIPTAEEAAAAHRTLSWYCKANPEAKTVSSALNTVLPLLEAIAAGRVFEITDSIERVHMTLNQHEVRRTVNALRAPDVSPQTAARAADLLDELAEDLARVIDELS